MPMDATRATQTASAISFEVVVQDQIRVFTPHAPFARPDQHAEE